MPRTRSIIRSRVNCGSYTMYNRTYSPRWNAASRYEWMEDDPIGSAPYHDKPAKHRFTRRKLLTISGRDRRHGTTRATFQNYAIAYPIQSPMPSHIWQNWGLLKNKSLAQLSPSPPVDVPLFLWELRELPKLLRDTGQFLMGRRTNPGDAVLAANFGWGPLLSDLRTFLNFIEESEKQEMRIKSLEKTKRLEVKLSSDSNSSPPDSGTTFNIGYVLSKVSRSYEQEVRAWAVAKIKSSIPLPPINRDLKSALTRALRHQSPETIWNAIPWTWLIDYCFNIGTFIAATRGYLSYDLDNICIMQRSEARYRYEFVQLNFFEGSIHPGSNLSTEWQRRVYWDPKPGIYLTPILSGKQLSNLVALGVSSRPRYSQT